MRVNKDCPFCKEINCNDQNYLNKSRIVMETDNFVVLPTLGCFCKGYLLVLPKNHVLSMSDLSYDKLDELHKITNIISKYIWEKMNMKRNIFEHGTKNEYESTSTSIEHAHLHIVPFDGQVLRLLPKDCSFKRIKGFNDLKFETNNYLYLNDINNNDYIVQAKNYLSQFFRRIVCEGIGMKHFWDWKEYPFVDNVETTLSIFNGISERENLVVSNRE